MYCFRSLLSMYTIVTRIFGGGGGSPPIGVSYRISADILHYKSININNIPNIHI